MNACSCIFLNDHKNAFEWVITLECGSASLDISTKKAHDVMISYRTRKKKRTCQHYKPAMNGLKESTMGLFLRIPTWRQLVSIQPSRLTSIPSRIIVRILPTTEYCTFYLIIDFFKTFISHFYEKFQKIL